MVYILLSAKRRAYFCKSIETEMGGVSRCFSKISGSRVDLTLSRDIPPKTFSLSAWPYLQILVVKQKFEAVFEIAGAKLCRDADE